jgi:hypothetical protein
MKLADSIEILIIKCDADCNRPNHAREEHWLDKKFLSPEFRIGYAGSRVNKGMSCTKQFRFDIATPDAVR